MLWPEYSWNRRDVKKILAKKSNNIDCAIIGSSHVYQVSSVRKNKSLTNICESITNLGVDGGTFEDFLALSYELINKKQKPNTIVFGITPWALDFYRDKRWGRYGDSYYSMKEILTENKIEQNSKDVFDWSYLVNLINPLYFLQSIEQVGKKELKINEAPVFEHSIGLDTLVMLADGSIISRSKSITNSKTTRIPVGGTVYKIRPGSVYSEVAIALFTKLVRKLNESGINTVILMTPYHHNVWLNNNPTKKVLLEVEARIRKLGSVLGIDVLGSYNPEKNGCSPDEFFDHMHAKDSCLSKIAN